MAALHARCFDEAPRPWSAAEFEAALGDPKRHVSLAEEAFAVTQIIADEAELLTIAVAPEARRTGIGQGLMDDVIAACLAAGVVELFLEVDATNRAARALYDRNGFVVSGQRKGYYRRSDGRATDALVMVRALVTPRHG